MVEEFFSVGVVAWSYWGAGTSLSGKPTGVSTVVVAGTDIVWYCGLGFIDICTVWVFIGCVGTLTILFQTWTGTKVIGGICMRIPDWTGEKLLCFGAWAKADVDWIGTYDPTCTYGIIDGFAYIYIK